MSRIGVAENLIEHEFGCGAFQWLLVTFVYWLPSVPQVCAVQMMVFGGYNPGWTCVDNASSLSNDSNSISSNITVNTSEFENETTKEGLEFSCSVFKDCQHVHFSVETSTVASEWGLVCDKAPISSLIISIQMTGMFVGALFSGTVADVFGRKLIFYASLLALAVLNFVSILSTSWTMFAVFRFFLGVVCAGSATSHYLYPSEFLSMKWRGPFTGSPVWPVSGILFAVFTMLLKDWKQFLALTSVMTVICCIPAVWFPESLRWLEVKNKQLKFKMAAEKIASTNGRPLPQIESSQFLTQAKSESTKKNDKYIFLQLFRPGYRVYTMIFAFIWFSLSTVFFSISYGVRVLGGDFYINLITLNAMTLPFVAFAVMAPNAIGRKKGALISCAWIPIFSGGAIGFELLSGGKVKDIGILISLTVAVAGVECCQGMLTLLMSEIYPTVVRGVVINWGSFIVRFAAIIAPFVIPDESGTVYYWYLIMAILGLVSSCLILWLPETRGEQIKETFGIVTQEDEAETKDRIV